MFIHFRWGVFVVGVSGFLSIVPRSVLVPIGVKWSLLDVRPTRLAEGRTVLSDSEFGNHHWLDLNSEFHDWSGQEVGCVFAEELILELEAEGNASFY